MDWWDCSGGKTTPTISTITREPSIAVPPPPDSCNMDYVEADVVDERFKNCPYCGEQILAAAIKCKHCHEMLTAAISPNSQRLPSAPLMPAAALPQRVQYNPSTDTFVATMALMIKLAMRAIQELGWKLDNINESIGLVTFETGISWGSFSGVSCSLNIEEVRQHTFRVRGTGKQNPSGALRLSWDLFSEAKGKAAKAINKMKELAC